ncbi:DUF1963 domain-containing protein [Ruminococcaceae bacterium OttesenSCG-928-L11]|nr:DUF1963 domain-containing protein [Ruminococcaceae bacterium OttesenSCG-928-L11]
MGILSFFKKNKLPEEAPKQETAIPPEMDRIVQEFTEQTIQPTLSLKAVRGGTTVFSSKFGGTPYLPQGFAYPHNEDSTSDKKPLKLLAQLNFTELPPLPGFPAQGILQFYVAYEEKDDVQGLDFDNPISQGGFRIIYHKDIVLDESLLQEPPALEDAADVYFPFKGEFALIAEPVRQAMSPNDFRFDAAFLKTYERYLPTDKQRVWELDSTVNDIISDTFSGTGHRIGGYPFFTQEDPRGYGKYEDYTFLLLQIDSDGRGDDEIIWGDCGVANFFITPEQLKACDFTKVLYNWDCY